MTEVIVVDSDCPDGARAWAASLGDPRVRVVRAPPSPWYRHARVKNAGAATARTPWLFFLDADVSVAPGLEEVLRGLEPGSYARADVLSEGLGGQMIVPRSAFERASGFDETYRGYGDEDIDLHRRLKFHGLQLRPFPAALLSHESHDNALRTRSVDDVDAMRSMTYNAAYGLAKIELMRVLGTELDGAFREAMYRTLREKTEEACRTGTPQRVELGLPDTHLPSVMLSRTYVLTLSPTRAPRV